MQLLPLIRGSCTMSYVIVYVNGGPLKGGQLSSKGGRGECPLPPPLKETLLCTVGICKAITGKLYMYTARTGGSC